MFSKTALPSHRATRLIQLINAVTGTEVNFLEPGHDCEEVDVLVVSRLKELEPPRSRLHQLHPSEATAEHNFLKRIVEHDGTKINMSTQSFYTPSYFSPCMFSAFGLCRLQANNVNWYIAVFLHCAVSDVLTDSLDGGKTRVNISTNAETCLSYHRLRVCKFAEELTLLTIRTFLGRWNLLPPCEIHATKPFGLVLWLDGEGSAGYITSRLLHSLIEDAVPNTDVDINLVFDKIYAASSGAMVAGILWSGSEALKDLSETFEAIARDVFSKPNWVPWLRRVDKYTSKKLDASILKYMPISHLSPVHKDLKALIPELVIVVTDDQSNTTCHFGSSESTCLAANVRAAMAVRTLFPPMVKHETTFQEFSSGVCETNPVNCVRLQSSVVPSVVDAIDNKSLNEWDSAIKMEEEKLKQNEDWIKLKQNIKDIFSSDYYREAVKAKHNYIESFLSRLNVDSARHFHTYWESSFQLAHYNVSMQEPVIVKETMMGSNVFYKFTIGGEVLSYRGQEWIRTKDTGHHLSNTFRRREAEGKILLSSVRHPRKYLGVSEDKQWDMVDSSLAFDFTTRT